jgi:hypothetical protein
MMVDRKGRGHDLFDPLSLAGPASLPGMCGYAARSGEHTRERWAVSAIFRQLLIGIAAWPMRFR